MQLSEDSVPEYLACGRVILDNDEVRCDLGQRASEGLEKALRGSQTKVRASTARHCSNLSRDELQTC